MNFEQYTTKPPTSDELVQAYLSKMPQDEEIDAWGMARAIGIEPVSANIALDRMVTGRLLVRRGSWYSKNSPA